MTNTPCNLINENTNQCYLQEKIKEKGITIIEPFFIEKDTRKLRFESTKKFRDEQFKRICKTFGISDNDETLAKHRFESAASGRELREINQLNSSALLAFLCFHKVSDDFPILINEEKYTDVLFEITSNLQSYGRSTPRSNVDVVLLNKTNALFLESKFSEYLTPRPYKVKPYYRDSQAYNNLFDKTIKWDARTSSHEKFIIEFDQDSCLWKSSKPVYLEGIKQMICHYLGISNQLELYKNNQQLCKDWKRHGLGDRNIKLGEIVFKFHTKECTVAAFDFYSAAYKGLCEKIKNKTEEIKNKTNDDKPKPTILDNLLTYQEVFGDSRNSKLLTDATKQFYRLNQ